MREGLWNQGRLHQPSPPAPGRPAHSERLLAFPQQDRAQLPDAAAAVARGLPHQLPGATLHHEQGQEAWPRGQSPWVGLPRLHPPAGRTMELWAWGWAVG